MRVHLSIRALVCCAIGLLVLAGCKAQSPPPPPHTQPAGAAAISPASRPADEIAFLSLDEIEPRPVLAKVARALSSTSPATAPSERPSLDAIELFARARDSLAQNRRFTAINLLERAIALDPDSYELHYALGQAYQVGRAYDDQSIAAMLKAAAIDPDHLPLQTDLGRQYLAKGDAKRAIEHLRLAAQTGEYAADDGGAAVADLFLARALQQEGYDRAALEVYARLLRRVKGHSISVRTDPHLAYLVSERLQTDIGDLYAKHGQHEQALAAYAPAAERRPTDFELQAKVVRTLSALGRHDEATTLAADFVTRFRASAESLALLRETYRAAGREGQAIDELRRLHEFRPRDTALLFALTELLAAGGQTDEAELRLAEAADADPDDFEIARRRFQLRRAAGDPGGAARMLVETVAHRPDFAAEVQGLWTELTRVPSQPAAPTTSPTARRIRLLPVLQSMSVPPDEEPARLWSLAHAAEQARREGLAGVALRRTVEVKPPFAPAFRDLLARIWANEQWDDARKSREAEQLAAAASARGDAALAEELRGLTLIHRGSPAEALKHFDAALENGGSSPQLQFAHAAALKLTGDTARFEQAMWKLMSDRPSYPDAYVTLHGHYAASSPEQAERVLSTWLAATPDSVTARIFQARSYFAARRVDAAQAIVDRLLDERDDLTVLAAARSLYEETGQLDRLITRLEAALEKEPDRFGVVMLLVDVYADRERTADAERVLGAARATFADDPDVLYQVAHLFQRIGQKEGSERVLRDVLTIEPDHAPAANDLGYFWAEQGTHLDRAEKLTRLAVRAEPENVSFLDSLGWVLYKRGRLAEARDLLERAVASSAAQPDPVVLDHLGDAAYRGGDRDAAAAHWARATKRLAEMDPAAAARDDLRGLKLQLDLKAKQLKAGQPVDVSPVAERADGAPASSANTPVQAKN